MSDLEIWTLVLSEWNEAVTNPRYWTCPQTKVQIFVTQYLHEGICHSLQKLCYVEHRIDLVKYHLLRFQLPGRGETFVWTRDLDGAKSRVEWLTRKVNELQNGWC